MSAEVRYIGVRHHSPACSRLVRHVVHTWQPTCVLVEGPADFSSRIPEFFLGHTLPVAIFSFVHGQGRALSWAPFCEYSPEWVALAEGHSSGAELAFIDLPMWSKGMARRENRYSDGVRRYENHVRAFCERFGCDGYNALWDHLFEQPLEIDALAERLEAYFDELRADVEEEIPESDHIREACMAGHIAQHAAAHERVLVVCGGLHRAALISLAADPPPIPTFEAPEDASYGSYLVPYSFGRMDSFVGYQSGMPSPAFYQAVWDRGPDAAIEHTLVKVALRLRKLEQPASTADLIAAETMARGLQRMRGHKTLGRVDLLDGMAAALVKDALSERLPWTQDGMIRPGTHPLLVEIVRTLSGERRGKLAEDTPAPPLVGYVLSALEEAGVELTPKKNDLHLDLAADDDRRVSALLACLQTLSIPGFILQGKPNVRLSDLELQETWTVFRSLDLEASLIEASSWGGTLKVAVASLLHERIAASGRSLGTVMDALNVALRCDLAELFEELASQARERIPHAHQLAELGTAIDIVRWALSNRAQRPAPRGAVAGLGIELLKQLALAAESTVGPSEAANADRIRAVEAAVRLLVLAPQEMAPVHMLVLDTFARILRQPDHPPDLRGAGLGCVWILRRPDNDLQELVRRATRPETLGDFLAGLFGVARESVRVDGELVELVDSVVASMSEEEFLECVPSLRLAFQFFPRRERAAVARLAAALHGREGMGAQLLAAVGEVKEVVDTARLERSVTETMRTYGLLPEGTRG